jgi:hypothetical protein
MAIVTSVAIGGAALHDAMRGGVSQAVARLYSTSAHSRHPSAATVNVERTTLDRTHRCGCQCGLPLC